MKAKTMCLENIMQLDRYFYLHVSKRKKKKEKEKKTDKWHFLLVKNLKEHEFNT